jgi:DNA-directed RNA polymerase subunit K/omega
MARFTSQKAAIAAGGQFRLVLVASQRARELHNGALSKIEDDTSSVNVLALKEIEQGLYTYEDFIGSSFNDKKRTR